ncbi:MAG: hypothetical protein J6C13_03370 [Clostridia bacterium]|nr:hypothetical protein [Clostridia bacterium]
MGRFATKRFALFMGVVVTFCLVVALSVVLLYKPAPTAPTLELISNDNTVEASTNIVSNGANLATVTGGSYSNSGTTYTATPDSNYVLGYWSLGSASGVKYATDLSVTSSSAIVPTMIAKSSLTYVSTAAQLTSALSSNANIVLTQDIIATSGFTPAGTYSGVLDGAGYSITVNVSGTTANVGGVCQTLTGVIKNLEIRGYVKNTSATASYNVGAFAGTINGGLVSRCENHSVVSSAGGIAGGIVGAGYASTRASTIYYCYNYGAITGASVGAVIYTNGTESAPYVNLVSNYNAGALKTIA